MPITEHIIIAILCILTSVKCKIASKDSNACSTTEMSKYYICTSSLNLTSCFQHNITQSQRLSQAKRRSLIQTLQNITHKLQQMFHLYRVNYNGSNVFYLCSDTGIPGPEFSSCYDTFLSNLSALSSEMTANSVCKNPSYASTDESYRKKWKIIHDINLQYIERTLIEIKHLSKTNLINSTILPMFDLENLQSFLRAYEQYLQLEEQLHHVEIFQVMTVNYVDPLIFTAIILVGIGGNVSLLIIFIRNRQMCTAANVMFINLTIVDTLFLVVHLIIYKMGFILPLYIKYFDNDSQVYAYYFFILFTTGLAVYSVVVISIQRYCVLYSCRGIQKYNISFLLVGSVWVMAALLAIPDTELVLERRIKLVQTLSFGNHNFQFIAYGIVPSLTIAVFYWASARKVPQEIPGESLGRDRVKRARARSKRILHFLTILFIITYIPSLLFILVLPTLNPENQTVQSLTMVYIAKCLMFLNSSCNPIMLYIGSEKFRRCFKKCFLWFTKESSDGKSCTTTDS